MAAPAGTARPQARDTRLADTMVRLTHAVRRAFADASRAHDLTPVQAELLCVLTTGRTTMTELSHLLDIEKSSLSGLVDRAERRGLVRRAQLPGDRRRYYVELTHDGGRVALACHHEVTRRLEALARGLPATSRNHLVAGMAHLIAAHEAERLQREARTPSSPSHPAVQTVPNP
jgi:DNA-binding MarR family transcriptional regulator